MSIVPHIDQMIKTINTELIISANNMTEDTYSIVWKLETQLIIKPRVVIQEYSGEKINEQRGEYLVQG